VQAAKQRKTHDVMVAYVYNATSPVNAQSSSTSSILAVNTSDTATDPLIGVIVVLSLAVVGGIFFVICGLFLKAEAHLRSGRQATREGLLVEPPSLLWDT